MHSTKLDLRAWIAAIFLVLTPSKGVSSIVMGQMLGVNQKTVWKLGHAIRDLMDNRERIVSQLGGMVEVDESFVGGTPKFKKGVKNKRGRGTKKPVVLVAISRNGQAKASLVPNAQGATLGPNMKHRMEPQSILMREAIGLFAKSVKHLLHIIFSITVLDSIPAPVSGRMSIRCKPPILRSSAPLSGSIIALDQSTVSDASARYSVRGTIVSQP